MINFLVVIATVLAIAPSCGAENVGAGGGQEKAAKKQVKCSVEIALSKLSSEEREKLEQEILLDANVFDARKLAWSELADKADRQPNPPSGLKSAFPSQILIERYLQLVSTPVPDSRQCVAHVIVNKAEPPAQFHQEFGDWKHLLAVLAFGWKDYFVKEIPDKLKDRVAEREDRIDVRVGYMLNMHGGIFHGKRDESIAFVESLVPILARDKEAVTWLSRTASLLGVNDLPFKARVQSLYAATATDFAKLSELEEQWRAVVEADKTKHMPPELEFSGYPTKDGRETGGYLKGLVFRRWLHIMKLYTKKSEGVAAANAWVKDLRSALQLFALEMEIPLEGPLKKIALPAAAKKVEEKSAKKPEPTKPTKKAVVPSKSAKQAAPVKKQVKASVKAPAKKVVVKKATTSVSPKKAVKKPASGKVKTTKGKVVFKK